MSQFFGRIHFTTLAAVVWLLGTFAATAANKAPTSKTPTKTAPTPVVTPEPAYHSPSYYFNIDLDSHYQFTGIGALTEEQSAKSNCYRFFYNADGKLQQVEYRRAGSPMVDPLLGVAQINFEYAPGIERRWFHDEKGQPSTTGFAGVQGEELKLNAAGYPESVTNLDANGGHLRDASGVITYVRTLDALNRLIKGRRLGLLGTEITDRNGIFELRKKYDETGHQIEVANFDSDGKPLNDDNGVAVTRTTYTLYPDSTTTIETYYDAGGLAVSEKDSGVHQLQRTTDSRGFLLDEAYFDESGAQTTSTNDGVHERKYTYDDRGNEITEEFLDVNGKPVEWKGPDSSNYAKVVYKYDDKNRVIEKSYFGDDGLPQVNLAVGAAIIRHAYDKQGNLIRRVFLDGQGHPTPHIVYGAPVISIKVDGDTTMVTLRNDEGRQVKNPIKGYYAFSYKTDKDKPLSPFNTYYDRHGREMSLLRVDFINPHLHALSTSPLMKWSAWTGAAAAGIGALLASWMALRKSRHTKRRKVYIPSPLERFLGWLAVFGIFEGTLRFLETLYWAWVGYQNGHMSHAIYVVETIFIIFFLYRAYRLTRTMRVLNIERDDVHRLIRDFFDKVGQKAEWVEVRNRYVTPPLDVRVNYYLKKFHAYLAFEHRGSVGKQLEGNLADYLRAQVGGILAPQRTAMIAIYYPIVALCYLLLAGLAFYTVFQMVKGY